MKSESGFSLLELLVVVVIIAIIAAIAIPSLLASRRAANESSAIQTLRTISSAEATYFNTNGATSNYGSLDQMNTAGMLDDSFTGTTFTKSGYTFVHTLPATPNAFCAHGVPTSSTSGVRRFGITQAGLIWQDLTAAQPCAAGVLDTTGGIPLLSN